MNTPATGAAAELPVVGYRYGTALLWADDAPVGEPDCEALTPHAPAQSQLDALREEVARLKAAAQESALQYLSDNGQWIEETGRLRAELAALKAQPTDVDALMALADDYALRYFQCIRHGTPDDVANKNATREALRAKLAARKEPT